MQRQINTDDIHVLRVGTVSEWNRAVQAVNELERQPHKQETRKVLGSIRDVVGAKRSPTMSEAFA